MSTVTQQTEILGLVNDKFGSTLTTTDVEVALLSTEEGGKTTATIKPVVDSKYYSEDEVKYLRRVLGKYFYGVSLVLELKPEELTFGAALAKIKEAYGLDISDSDIVDADSEILYTPDMPDLAIDIEAAATSLTWEGTLNLKVRGYWNSIARLIEQRDLYGLTYLVGDGDLPTQLLTNAMNFTGIHDQLSKLTAGVIFSEELAAQINQEIGYRTAAGMVLPEGDPAWKPVADGGMFDIGTAKVLYNGAVADSPNVTSNPLPYVCVLELGEDALGLGGYVLLAYDKPEIPPESYSLTFTSDGTSKLLIMHNQVWEIADFVYPTGDITGTVKETGKPIAMEWNYDEEYIGNSPNPALATKEVLPEGTYTIDFKYDGPLSESTPEPNSEHPWAKLTAVWQWGDIMTTGSNTKLSNRPTLTTIGKYFSRLLTKYTSLSDIFNGSNVWDIRPGAFSGFVNVNSAYGLLPDTTHDVVLQPETFFGLNKLLSGSMNGIFGYSSTISRVEGQQFNLDDRSGDTIYAIYGNNGHDKLEYLHPAALDGICDAPKTVYSPFYKSKILAADVPEDFYDRWSASLTGITNMWYQSKDLDYVPMMHKRFPNLESLNSFIASNPLIVDIPVNTFEGMTKLKSLNSAFQGTGITAVDPQLLAPVAGTLENITALYANTKLTDGAETGLGPLTKAKTATRLFQGCTFTALPSPFLPAPDALVDIGQMFSNCKQLKAFNLVNLNAYVNIGSISGMFNGCVELEDVSGLGTLPAGLPGTDLSSLFINCAKITTVPLQELFTSFPNARQMGSMFSGTGLTMDSADIVTAIQKLSATNATKFNCYQMFANTKITGKGADIIAAFNAVKTGGSFSAIFRNCTTLSDYATLASTYK